MFKRFTEIKNLELLAGSDEIGSITDLLLEDHHWQVRYLVVKLGDVLHRQKVLISTAVVNDIDFKSGCVSTTLDRQQIYESPPVECGMAISRQYERSLVDYYGWPIYWLGRIFKTPQSMTQDAETIEPDRIEDDSISHLRSANELTGYQIESRTGKAGYMKDLVVNLNSWRVEYATAADSSWTPRERSVFSTSQIEKVDWVERNIAVDLPKTKLERPSNQAVMHRASITGEPQSSQPFCIDQQGDWNVSPPTQKS